MTNNKSAPVVDPEFHHIVSQRCWHINSSGYWKSRECRGGVRRNVFLHRVVWRLKFGWVPKELDHINGDRNDNRICNLRVATRTLQMLNQSSLPKSHKSSGLPRGVSIDRRRTPHKYQARIGIEGRSISIGVYDTPEEASSAYMSRRNQLIREESERANQFAQ